MYPHWKVLATSMGYRDLFFHRTPPGVAKMGTSGWVNESPLTDYYHKHGILGTILPRMPLGVTKMSVNDWETVSFTTSMEHRDLFFPILQVFPKSRTGISLRWLKEMSACLPLSMSHKHVYTSPRMHVVSAGRHCDDCLILIGVKWWDESGAGHSGTPPINPWNWVTGPHATHLIAGPEVERDSSHTCASSWDHVLFFP